jgi:hypothetical protein
VFLVLCAQPASSPVAGTPSSPQRRHPSTGEAAHKAARTAFAQQSLLVGRPPPTGGAGAMHPPVLQVGALPRAPPPSAGASAPGAAAAVAIRACGGSAGTGAASTAPAPSPANRLAQPQWPQPGHGAQAFVGRHTFHPAEPFLPVPGSALRQAPSSSTPVIDGVVERPGLPAAASTSFFPWSGLAVTPERPDLRHSAPAFLASPQPTSIAVPSAASSSGVAPMAAVYPSAHIQAVMHVMQANPLFAVALGMFASALVCGSDSGGFGSGEPPAHKRVRTEEPPPGAPPS